MQLKLAVLGPVKAGKAPPCHCSTLIITGALRMYPPCFARCARWASSGRANRTTARRVLATRRWDRRALSLPWSACSIKHIS